MKKILLIALLFFAGVHGAFAAVVAESVEYKHGETVLEGYVAYDDATEAKRPGVLVVHEWTGLGAYAKKRAEQLASLGYVAFAVDIYGKGIRPDNPKDASTQAAIYKNDRSLMRARVTEGLKVLQAHPLVDSAKIAAIGYCFGGTTVLELARSGAGIKGVVSFHGGLSTPNTADAKNIRCRVLALHGADDPFVPADEVKAFESEMASAGVDYKLVQYPGAVHSFTNPDAKGDIQGALYNEAADKASWQDMLSFFSQIFPQSS